MAVAAVVASAATVAMVDSVAAVATVTAVAAVATVSVWVGYVTGVLMVPCAQTAREALDHL